MDRRVAHDDSVHHEINAQAVQETANGRMIDHESNKPAREVKDGGDNHVDEKVKEETEQRSLQPAFKSTLTKSAARDRLQDPDRANVVADSEEDARVSNIEKTG